jgi:hypothetical protein
LTSKTPVRINGLNATGFDLTGTPERLLQSHRYRHPIVRNPFREALQSGHPGFLYGEQGDFVGIWVDREWEE